MKHQPRRSMLALIGMLLATSVLTVSGGPSKGLLDYASTLSGVFNDGKEVSKDVASNAKIVHDTIGATFMPIDIPFLRPDIVFYGLETVNGNVVRKEILVAKETGEGIYNLIRYKLKDPSRFGSKVPDPDDLASLKPKDLIDPVAECNSEMYVVDDNVYTGSWGICDDNAAHFDFEPTLSCKGFTVRIFTNSNFVKKDPVPYLLQKKESFPLLDYVTKDAAGWTPPCDNA